jgi:hypothetical protein
MLPGDRRPAKERDVAIAWACDGRSFIRARVMPQLHGVEVGT